MGLFEFSEENGNEGLCYVYGVLKDDMSRTPVHYPSHPRENFCVVECLDRQLGMDKENKAELRRMSASSTVRRHGGRGRLLEKSENFCRSRSYNRTILFKVDFLKPILAMHHENGYRLVKIEPYGAPTSGQVNIRHLVE